MSPPSSLESALSTYNLTVNFVMTTLEYGRKNDYPSDWWEKSSPLLVSFG